MIYSYRTREEKELNNQRVSRFLVLPFASYSSPKNTFLSFQIPLSSNFSSHFPPPPPQIPTALISSFIKCKFIFILGFQEATVFLDNKFLTQVLKQRFKCYYNTRNVLKRISFSMSDFSFPSKLSRISGDLLEVR